MTDLGPRARTVDLPAGRFRTLEWPGTGSGTAVFLHGLSGVADVWGDTVDALAPDRPRCVALDQRGHGHSPRAPGAYGAIDYLGDLLALVERLAPPIRLVGHSMGARVAILAAARHAATLASVVVVDIGPEAWQANIDRTARLFEAMPDTFEDRASALELGRLAGRGEEWADRFVDQRLRANPNGTYTWLAAKDALIETVGVQRARGYWRDWDRIDVPALLVRGAESKELRPRIAEQMRARSPRVRYTEIADVGHNIPLHAPTELATAIDTFWKQLA